MCIYAQRRAAFMEAMDQGVAIFSSAPPPCRSGGFGYPYRQNSDFYYLTGLAEPQAICILAPLHPTHQFVLLMASGGEEQEVWQGRNPNITAVGEKYGAQATYHLDLLEAKLGEYLQGAKRLYYSLGHQWVLDRRILARLANLRLRYAKRTIPREIVDPGVILNEMRLIKSPDEIKALKKAAAITQQAYQEALQQLHPGMYEYELEALLINVFRRHGGKAGYIPIVAAGSNALILHYEKNQSRMAPDELLLVDAGASIDYYTVDVTRTWPVSGKFNSYQRQIYSAVLAAMEAAMRVIGPGRTCIEFHECAVATLVQHLVELGLLQGSVDEIISRKKYHQYYMHRTGHWLGMDIHDVGNYFQDGFPRKLEPGMVLTVEPGLYIPQETENIDPGFQGIGVRLEDNLLVTADGYDNLTAAIPKTIAAIEDLLVS